MSGHRRKKACELAGLEAVRAEIKDLTRDEAIILMVESNYQRSSILPSEKAFAYKMRLEAMKRQAERLRKYIPQSVPFEKTEDYVLKALEYYQRYQQRQRDSRDSR